MTTDEFIQKSMRDLVKPSRKRGVPTGQSIYTEMQHDGRTFCVEVSVRKVEWCEEHRTHRPRKRRKKPEQAGIS